MLTHVANQPIRLLPQKAILLVEQRTLLVADMHVGKAMHFRRRGIALPPDSAGRDFQLLGNLLDTHTPETVVFLGDLFHSQENMEWMALKTGIAQHTQTRFALVPGNHDRFAARFCAEASLELLPEVYTIGPFMLSHAPLADVPAGTYNLCGHVHPGVALHGKGRMQVTLPCFWLGEKTGILPAFGNLTGLALITPIPGDRVVVIADGVCLDV